MSGTAKDGRGVLPISAAVQATVHQPQPVRKHHLEPFQVLPFHLQGHVVGQVKAVWINV